jgi:hypothetical protein
MAELAKIAGMLALLGHIPYIISIFRRKTIPNPVTWGIMGIMGGLQFASYVAAGNSEGLWAPISYLIGTSVIALLSLHYGRSEVERFDLYCLIGAGLSGVLWWLSGSPLVALTILILIDLMAIAPTLRKTYFKPESEDPLTWSMFWVANSTNLYVVSQTEVWSYRSLAYPIDLLFLDTSVLSMMILGYWLQRSSKVSRAKSSAVLTTVKR